MSRLEDVIGSLESMGVDPLNLNSEIEQLENEIINFFKEEGLECQNEYLNPMKEIL